MTQDVLSGSELGSSIAGSEYNLLGRASTGGTYNSHFIAVVAFVLLASFGWINLWLTIWVAGCVVAAFAIDRHPWRQKLRFRAMPSQLFLYTQVLLQAALHLLPWYVFAFLIYLCVAPVILPLNVAISSFVMLYAYYMITRTYLLLRYLWVIHFRWADAGHVFAVRMANLKSPSIARRHLLWSYCLGNVGLIVRCGVQVMTLGLFEFLRQAWQLDLSQMSWCKEHITLIFWVAICLWLATLWWALQPALIIYYRAHRTLHTQRGLYDGIHSIHHRGVLPTPLDSGTISPLEFFITEMAFPASTLVPNWWWTGGQIVLAIVGHLPSHEANSRWSTGQHHLLHHRYFTVNYGLTAREDERYGSLMPVSSTSGSG
ncbi:MAG: sterol desaturase family protein [Pirellulaceae bacterium]